ncbi:hypothetical protein ACOSP7_027806 [Xanthoceras sorbifolium]
MGIIFRDHSGSVLAACAHKLVASYSVIVAEALTVLKGLQFALASGLLLANVETDSLDVAIAINIPFVFFSEVELVIFDIVDLLGRCLGSKVIYVPRLANMVAHILARFALRLDRDFFWQDDYPYCISEALTVDNQVSG